MQYTPELMRQRQSSASISEDLQRAAECMDLSDRARNSAAARRYYQQARVAHDAADRFLKQKLPTSPSARAELGAMIARLRSRLVAYESVHL